MSRHNDTIYLRHMLEHARTAVGLASGKSRASLDEEPMLRYSLLHLITILGEAANRMSSEGRIACGQIPWRDVVGMRNMLIHGYDIVDMDILWKTVEADLPAMIAILEESLSHEDH